MNKSSGGFSSIALTPRNNIKETRRERARKRDRDRQREGEREIIADEYEWEREKEAKLQSELIEPYFKRFKALSL